MAVVTVAFEDLDSWLQEQPVNTKNTPYELEITGLTNDNYNGISTVLRNNPQKYLDLSHTELPTGITVFSSLFMSCTSLVSAPSLPSNTLYIDAIFFGCTSLINAPIIPNSVIDISNAFYNCTSLVNAPLISNSVTKMNTTFCNCTSLSHKPIIPSSVIESDEPYYGVTTPNWKGTESQVTAYLASLTLDATTDGFEIQVYNNDRVTLEDTYSVVGINKLSTYLASLSANTVDTSYKIEITGLTTSNFGNIKTALTNNNTKFVDLSVTNLPSGITDINSAFYNCTSLVCAPNIPNTVTFMTDSFFNCSNLIKAPVLPSNLISLYSTFDKCTSLVSAPIIPDSVVKMPNTFSSCTSLTNAPIIPDGVDDMSACFAGCSSLVKAPILPNSLINVDACFELCTSLGYKPIIPSTVTSSSNCFEGVTQTRWGGSTSQIDTWAASQTTEFEVIEIEADTESNCYEPTDRIVYGVDITNLSTWLSEQDENTTSTPFEVKILSITTSNYNDIKTALTANNTKYVDLRYTDLPSGITSLYQSFNECQSLIYSPTIPSSVTNLGRTFEGCTALISAPTIPSSVTNIVYCFRRCTSLVTAPTIPSGITSLQGTFFRCTSLAEAPIIPNSVLSLDNAFCYCSSFTTPPVLPSGVTDLLGVFMGCTNLLSAPVIPNTVTRMNSAFRECTSLTVAPIIPSSVTNLSFTFMDCISLTTVPNVPASVTTGVRMFNNCTSLRKIDKFEIPLATLRDNTSFQDMFQNCPSLESIGYVTKESDWHIWRLKYDVDNNNDVLEGEVYFKNGDYAEINSGTPLQITKSDLNLPVKTDELWFPKGQAEDDSAVKLLITKLLANKYGVFINDVLPPDEKTMVLWADDPSNVKSNFLGGGGSVFDIVYPVGCVYTQYPEQKSPAELGWSRFSTWEELDYGGAFFRAEGGNAGTFNNEKAVTAVSGKVLTIPSSGAVVGSLIYDPVGNETRTVTAVSGNNVTVNSAFTSTNLTNVLIGQEYNSSAQGLSLYSASSGGTANKTDSQGKHSHYMFALADYQGTGGYGDLAYGGTTGKQSGTRHVMTSGYSDKRAFCWTASQSTEAHTHNIYLRGTGETRGANFSVRIWKRTS